MHNVVRMCFVSKNKESGKSKQVAMNCNAFKNKVTLWVFPFSKNQFLATVKKKYFLLQSSLDTGIDAKIFPNYKGIC